MKHRILALIMAAVLLLPAAALGQDAANRVFDYAGVFSASEVSDLEDRITAFQDATGYDFAIMVSDYDHGYEDYQLLCDDFYIQQNLGLGMTGSAILCVLDLYEQGYFYIQVYGDFRYLMNETDVQYLASKVTGDYPTSFVSGLQWMIGMVQQAVTQMGEDNPTRVYDFAELLTEEEKQTLQAAIADFRSLSGRDFLYLSTYEAIEGNEDGYYMQEFYNLHGFGEGEERSGVMLYLDLDIGSFYVQNFGDMDTYVSQEDIDRIVQKASDPMAESEFLAAVLGVLDDYTAAFR